MPPSNSKSVVLFLIKSCGWLFLKPYLFTQSNLQTSTDCEFEGGIYYANLIVKTCISRGSQGNQRPTPFAPWIDMDQGQRNKTLYKDLKRFGVHRVFKTKNLRSLVYYLIYEGVTPFKNPQRWMGKNT